MDLTRLKWTKNVNHQGNDKFWAYQDVDLDSKVFRLHWKRGQEKNACKPIESELILLRQRTKLTHIVELVNNELYEEPTNTYWNNYRRVRAIWISDWNDPPHQNIVFQYPVNLQGGRVMELETLHAFRENWDGRGGLEAFQQYVQKVLNTECQK